MATCQITFLNVEVPLICKCGTISVQGLLSVDKIDTIFLIADTLCSLRQKPFWGKITDKWTEINKNKKFSTLWNGNIISTLEKLVFTKEIDRHSAASKSDA